MIDLFRSGPADDAARRSVVERFPDFRRARAMRSLEAFESANCKKSSGTRQLPSRFRHLRKNMAFTSTPPRRAVFGLHEPPTSTGAAFLSPSADHGLKAFGTCQRG
jgi:hypothetical protein